MSAAVYKVRLHEESENMYGLIGYIHGNADN